VVRLLAEWNDLEADSKGDYGRTPLFYAAERGHEAVVRLLVEQDDNMCLGIESFDSGTKTTRSFTAAWKRKATPRGTEQQKKSHFPGLGGLRA
jgi:ankyrin repeat protein